MTTANTNIIPQNHISLLIWQAFMEHVGGTDIKLDVEYTIPTDAYGLMVNTDTKSFIFDTYAYYKLMDILNIDGEVSNRRDFSTSVIKSTVQLINSFLSVIDDLDTLYKIQRVLGSKSINVYTLDDSELSNRYRERYKSAFISVYSALNFDQIGSKYTKELLNSYKIL